MAYIKELKVTYERKRVDDDILDILVDEAKDVFNLFKDMQDETKEKVVVLHLSPQLMILSYEVSAIGAPNAPLIEPVEIYRNAMLARAHSIIVVRNHSMGNCKPANDDSDVARKLYELGSIHSIALQDFIIIGFESYYSYVEEGHFSLFRKYNAYSP